MSLTPRKCPYCLATITTIKEDGGVYSKSGYQKKKICGRKSCVKQHKTDKRELRALRDKQFAAAVKIQGYVRVRGNVYKFDKDRSILLRKTMFGEWVNTRVDMAYFTKGEIRKINLLMGG